MGQAFSKLSPGGKLLFVAKCIAVGSDALRGGNAAREYAQLPLSRVPKSTEKNVLLAWQSRAVANKAQHRAGLRCSLGTRHTSREGCPWARGTPVGRGALGHEAHQ